MLIIQSPGTWVWLLYLIIAGENWSTWLSTLVAAAQVTVLLCQVLYYDYLKAYFIGKQEEHAKIITDDYSSPSMIN